MIAIRCGWALVVSAAVAVVACNDFEPVPRAVSSRGTSDAAPPPDTSDASPPDADTEASAPSSPCHACVEGQCGAECRGDKRCWEVYQCAAAKNCFEGKDQQAIIDCTRPCAIDLGVLASDPEVLKLFFMLDCGAQKCRAECRFP